MFKKLAPVLLGKTMKPNSDWLDGTNLSSGRSSNSSQHIVTYLLKARIVEPEKQPLLGNPCTQQ
jgi:hypothetical protein